jgi:predicted HicB family RNase H-like nuclease
MATGHRGRQSPRPTVQLFVRIDPTLKERVRQLAASRGSSENELVEKILADHVAREAKRGQS